MSPSRLISIRAARLALGALPRTDDEALSMVTPEQFNETWGVHHPTVFRYIVSRVGLNDAEDIANETYLAALKARATYRPEHSRSGALPWLLGVATRQIARHRERERRWVTRGALAQHAKHDDGPEHRIADASVAAEIAAALKELPARQRDAFLLHVLGDLDYEGVAEALGVPIGTVRSRIHRARAAVAARLQGEVRGEQDR